MSVKHPNWLILFALLMVVLVSCAKDEEAADETVQPRVKLESIELTAESLKIMQGTSIQITAMGHYSDLSTADITSQVLWESSNPDIASVSDQSTDENPAGLVRALAPGEVEISASLKSISRSLVLEIDSALLEKIQITPFQPSLSINLSPMLSFKATGIYSDGSTQDLTEFAVWRSSKAQVASVSNSSDNRGQSTNLASGETQISASFKEVEGSTKLTLTDATMDAQMEFTPLRPVIAKGTKIQLRATAFLDGKPVDVTDFALWSSSEETVAKTSNFTDNKGEATGLADGTTDVSASQDDISGDVNRLTVVNANLEQVQIDPKRLELTLGAKKQLRAFGVYNKQDRLFSQELTDQISWSSTNPEVALICNAAACKGEVTAISPGKTTIKASQPNTNVKTNLKLKVATKDHVLSKIQITPINPKALSDEQIDFKAIGIYRDDERIIHQDITTQAKWSLDDETLGAVSNEKTTKGRFQRIDDGEAVLTASLAEKSGNVTDSNQLASYSLDFIELSPVDPIVALGMVQPFKVTGFFKKGDKLLVRDLTQQATWSSADKTIALISNVPDQKGQVHCLSAGSVSVSVSYGSKTASSELRILDESYEIKALSIDPTMRNIAVGTSVDYKAIGIFSDGTSDYAVDLTENAVWYSNKKTVARVTNLDGIKGRTWGVAPGVAKIMASFTDAGLNTLEDAESIRVNGYNLKSIQIDPLQTEQSPETEVFFRAAGVFENVGGKKKSYAITRIATWQSQDLSTDTGVLFIGNASGSEAMAYLPKSGETLLQAGLEDVMQEELISVTQPQLESITLDPLLPEVVLGTKLRLRALGTYADDMVKDLSDSVIWSSDDPTTISVENGPDRRGVLTLRASGTANLTASFQGQTASTMITVKDSGYRLSSLEITPSSPTTVKGMSLPLTATGIFTLGSDSFLADLTGSVTWVSSKKGVAKVSNADGTHGRITGIDAGTTNITATWTSPVDGASFQSIVAATVSTGNLDALQIASQDGGIPTGFTKKIGLTGSFTGGTSLEVAEEAVWSSSDESVAVVSNQPGDKGLIKALKPGLTTITAHLDGKEVSFQLSVW